MYILLIHSTLFYGLVHLVNFIDCLVAFIDVLVFTFKVNLLFKNNCHGNLHRSGIILWSRTIILALYPSFSPLSFTILSHMILVQITGCEAVNWRVLKAYGKSVLH